MAAARRQWRLTPAEVLQIVADEPMRHQPQPPVWTPGALPEYLRRAARNPVELRRELEAEARAAALLAGRYLSQRGLTLIELLTILALLAVLAALWGSR